MAVVIFGAKGIGLPGLVKELQWISDEKHQDVSYILMEVPHDWQNMVAAYTESPVQDLEVEIRAQHVKKMVLMLNHNPRKFIDWLDFVKLLSERMESNTESFIASHLIIALNVKKEEFEMRRKQTNAVLQKTFHKSSLEQDKIILFETQNIQEFACTISDETKEQERPIASETCTQFKLLNNCHLFNTNEMIVTARSFPDLEKQVHQALGEINFETYELQFLTQDKRMQQNVPFTESVFESLERNYSYKKAKIGLSIIVKCPRCEREVTNNKSHEHCKLLQTAIKERDPLLLFLGSLKLQELFPLLKMEEITVELLVELESDEKLERIGIQKAAHRLKLIEAIWEKRKSEKYVPKRDVEACQAVKEYLDDKGVASKRRSKFVCGSAILVFIASFFNWCKTSGTCAMNCCMAASPKVIVVVVVTTVTAAAATGTAVYVHHQQESRTTAAPTTAAPTQNSTTSPIPPQISIYMKFMFFNVTNPEEVKAGNARPILKEVGPYVYSEIRHKENITDGGADSLYYNERRAYYFDQEESERSGCTGCQKNDTVMILSPVWALVNYAYPLIPRDLNIPLPPPYNVYGNITYNLISNLVAIFNASPEDGIFLNAPVDNILYEGVPTGLTDFAWQILQKAAPDLIPKINDAVPQFANGKFGIFKGKNDTVKDMFYRVNNDVGSCEFMQILEFNGKASLNDFWWPDVGRTPSATKMGGKGVCHDIKGTDGTLFAPGVDTDRSLWVFIPELCRSVWLDYDTDVTVMDIPVKRFRPGPKVFDMDEPDNFCYCPKFLECAVNTTDDTYDPTPCNADEFACLDGLLHVGKCLIGNVNPDLPPLPAPFDNINTSSIDVALPISISSPHFFHADPKLLNQFEGLSPDQAIHDVTLDLDPTTGWAITTHKRIQINMPLTKIHDFIPFQFLNHTFPAFPIMWIDEHATLEHLH